MQQVVRTQSGAGVDVLHHDIRTAPESMTAKALAKSGASAPAKPSYAGNRHGSGHSGGPRKPYRGQGDGRPSGGRGPAAGGSAYGKGRKTYGKKPAGSR